MSVTGTLLHFGLKNVFDVSSNELVAWIEERFADSSRRLPRAILTANQRAWQVVGLALTEDGFVGKVRDVLRDGDLKAARKEIRQLIEDTPSVLALAPGELRTRAAGGFDRLRRDTNTPDANALERGADSLRRLSDPSALADEARKALVAVPDTIRASAPHLVAVLELTPAGGTPLLSGVFLFFFRRSVERDAELCRGLTQDQLRALAELTDARTAGILDQFDALFDDLAKWFAAADGKFNDIRAKLDRLLDERSVSTRVVDPLKVSVTNERELAQLRLWRDELRKLPPELLGAADWSKLGDALAAGRLFAEAQEAHKAAAKAAVNQSAEAEAEFKAYRDACEQENWDDALKALVRATELDPARFAPFPLKRYEPVSILGAGGFGTVIRCRQRLAKGREVAVKTFHTADLGRDVDDIFAEAHALSELADRAIVKILHWEFADPSESRPYLVMEYFPGVSLAAHLKQHGRLIVGDFLAVARQVAEAMTVAHASNILHRDLKPGNVLLRFSGEPGMSATGGWDVRVIDFGLAVRFSAVQASVSTSQPQRTRRDQSFAGTLEYASPEQKSVIVAPVGPRSDVYSFGKTMLEALLGTTEPVTDDWEVVAEAFREPLKRVLEKCITRDPAHRHAGFAPISQALTALVSTPVVDRESPKPEPPKRTKYENLIDRMRAVKAKSDQEQEERRKKEEQAAAEQKRLSDEAARKLVERLQAAKAASVQEEQRKREEQVAAEQKRRAEEARKQTEEWERETERQEREEAAQREAKRRQAEERVKQQQAEAERVKAAAAEETRRQAEEWERATEEMEREEASQRDAKRRTEEAARKTTEETKNQFSPSRVRVPGQTLRFKMPGDVVIAFAWCPPGSFQMGSNPPEVAPDWCKNERPAHKVTLTKGYFMGIHPVTQAQWVTVMGTDPSHFKGPNRPVESVTWDQCKEFCAKLTGRLQGQVTVRLPTEAEWEYAGRAGAATDYHYGDDISPDLANYKETHLNETTDVGSFPANRWGLYDIHGNVWEWCADWYGPYTAEAQANPTGPTQGSSRVLRGGAYRHNQDSCRAAYRFWHAPTNRGHSIGFRVCFNLE